MWSVITFSWVAFVKIVNFSFHRTRNFAKEWKITYKVMVRGKNILKLNSIVNYMVEETEHFTLNDLYTLQER